MRIYLAGPEVFLADAEAVAAAKRAVCAAHGLLGVFPLEPPPVAPDAAQPEWLRIYWANEAHIRGCDALIANLTPFRGASADVGTVYELGLMRALGRPVFGYSNTARRFGARTLAALGGAARRRADGTWEDAEGMAVEEFDRHDNLMLEGGIAASGGAFEAEEVPPERRWHDLAAFTRCVAAAARVLRAG
ncbi:nucleoside 2-deoxyribosyltransferase [Paracraurococcus lichenis]|uniref:Nucleoside 2-deoxyribosyltransferase n=1 Tax=Paracraurococcus lichenis TaxID=3064888 RepID=A0ABT9DZT0_9PROT|nr:nucleoside 2-deoxyribosyltransferase [Paracraurococcus sp. LOR1-02]MDO9709417.1 nucleoside 2-deoxyribosyltransferase [Paracraurococcus sp. LOR1-02]